jgi:hypothetical protein
MSAARRADLQVIFVLSASGLRCGAAIAAHRIGVHFDATFTMSNSALIIPRSALRVSDHT